MQETMDRSLFKHSYALSVRNYEIDWQGIVHNGNYLLYCEVGRVEYLRHIGATVDLAAINGPSKVVLVRNEIDYRNPATLGQEIQVLTRVSSIGNTSFIMEGMLLGDNDLVFAENVAYHVWLDPETNRPIRVPDDFRDLVRRFEGRSCIMGDEEQP